jgi:DNA repair exonuclease SbcCD ATPase subunit
MKEQPVPDQPKLIYKQEYEIVEKIQQSIEQQKLSPDELTNKLNSLCQQYLKLLNTTVKLTKLSDAYQKKLLLAKEDAEEKTKALENALSEIDTLSGLLPICSNCKQIRDEIGDWHQIESYITNHSEAEFSHSLCPSCFKSLYPKYSHKLK